MSFQIKEDKKNRYKGLGSSEAAGICQDVRDAVLQRRGAE